MMKDLQTKVKNDAFKLYLRYISRMQRQKMTDDLEECLDSIKDHAILKYWDPLIKKVIDEVTNKLWQQKKEKDLSE